MSKIKRDECGNVYVIVNGGVYRPQAGPHEYPVAQRNWGKGVQTVFAAGDEVAVRHRAQTPFCTVTSPAGVIELWTVHSYDVRNPGCLPK